MAEDQHGTPGLAGEELLREMLAVEREILAELRVLSRELRAAASRGASAQAEPERPAAPVGQDPRALVVERLKRRNRERGRETGPIGSPEK